MTTAGLEIRSDCSRCAALCCIAFPSDEMPGFSASKQAGEPCPKLDQGGRCTIYDRREQEGFGGCIRFECFGAGQHVTQTLFGGRDWRDDPRLLDPMVEAFLSSRRVFELLYLVNHAKERELDPGQTETIEALKEELAEIAHAGGTPQGLDRIDGLLREIFAQIGR
jgi:hypothetical protein